jgi:hypothetical protein
MSICHRGWQPDRHARLAADDLTKMDIMVSLFEKRSSSFVGQVGDLTTSLELRLLHDGAANTLVSVGPTVTLQELW